MKMKRLVAVFVAMLFAPCLFAQSAFAAQSASTELSLTIHCVFDNVVVNNAMFKLYRIANGAEDGFAYVAPFDQEGLPAYSDSISKDERQKLVELLTAAVNKNGIAPYRIGLTNENGSLVFDSLENGVYLVLSDESRSIGDEVYYPLPLLIHLPYTQDGKSTDNPVSVIKYDKKPNEIVTTTTTTTTPSTPPPEIPRTGQLWWPVYVLGSAGTLLIALGLIGRKRKGDAQ